MPDISDTQSALNTKITGQNVNGVETNPVNATPLNDLQVADVPNQTGLNEVLNLTTSPIEGKIGASALANRKYIEMQALTTGVKWGYSIASQPFDLFKNQFFSLPMGENCKIYFRAETGTAQVAFGEK